MSDPQTPDPQRPGRGEPPLRSAYWSLLALGVLLAFVTWWMFGITPAKDLSFGEFRQGVETGTWNAGNVHELEFDRSAIRFQDQPRKTPSLGILKYLNVTRTEDKSIAQPTRMTPQQIVTPVPIANASTTTPAGLPKADATLPAETTSADTTAREPDLKELKAQVLKDADELMQATDADIAEAEAAASGQQSTAEAKRFIIYTHSIAPESIAALQTLLDAKGIHKYRSSQPPVDWQTLLYFGLLLSLLFFLLSFVRKIGPGAALSFGRSRGRLYGEDGDKVTFANVAGIDEAVEELREIVEFLKLPGKYQALGGRIPHGVLLVGPPGTGKTLLAKAVAGEAGVPFFSLSGSDFVEMYVGVGAARVRDMFVQAVQKAPSIIFIDELDALGKTRGSGAPGGHDERDQTLNALLVEMDGFASDESVIVMAATNRPETLDSALMRPGRFDRHVLVDRPSLKGREAILNVHIVKIKKDDDVNVARLAKLTPGFVGADLANLVNEAALLAARRNRTTVSMAECEESIERVVAGLEMKSKVIQEDEKLRLAYHECGHALVASSLPHTDPVHKISIIPRGLSALGYMMQRPGEERHIMTERELRADIAVLLGGIAAEELIFNETSTGPRNDLERATDNARRMVTEYGMSPKLGRVNYRETRRNPFLAGAASVVDGATSEQTLREIDLEVRRLLDEAMQVARDILRDRRPVLEQMTKELLEVEVMDSEHLGRILEAHKTGPQIKPGTFIDRPNRGEDAHDESAKPGESSRSTG